MASLLVSSMVNVQLFEAEIHILSYSLNYTVQHNAVRFLHLSLSPQCFCLPLSWAETKTAAGAHWEPSLQQAASGCSPAIWTEPRCLSKWTYKFIEREHWSTVAASSSSLSVSYFTTNCATASTFQQTVQLDKCIYCLCNPQEVFAKR